MKKKKLFLILPAVLTMSSCTVEEALGNTKGFFTESIPGVFTDKIPGAVNNILHKDNGEEEQKQNDEDKKEEQGNEEKKVTSIFVSGSPETVVQGGTVDPSMVTLTVRYSDLSKEEVLAESITGLDTSEIGETTGYAVYHGEQYMFTINVISAADAIHVTSLELDNKYPTLRVGETHQIETTIFPSDATDKSCSFVSADETKVTVSSSGLLTGIAPTTSQVEVTVTSNDNPEVSVVMKVTVLANAADLPATTQAGFSRFAEGAELKNGELVNFVSAKAETIYYMPYYTSGNNIKGVTTTVEGETLVVPSTADFTVVKNSDNTYSFQDGNAKYLAATGADSGNYLKVVDEINDAAKFNLVVEDGYVTLKAVGAVRNTLCFNVGGSDPLFACYAEDKVENHNKVALYHNGIETSGLVDVTGVEFAASSYEVEIGYTTKVKASVAPANATEKGVTYSLTNVSPEGCATIDGDTITGVAAGTATVVATSVSDPTKTAEAPLSIIAAKAPDHAGTLADPFDADDALLIAGRLASGAETADSYYIAGPVASIKDAWSSQYKNVSFFIGGFLCYRMLYGEAKAGFESADDIAVGDNVIINATIKNYNGTLETGSGYVYDIARTGAAPVLTLDASSATLGVGAQQTVTATVTPIYAETKVVTWSSSDEGVATVSNGVITGVAGGTAVITATCGTTTATVNVEVTTANIPVNSVSLSASTASLVHIPGEPASLTLTATLDPAAPTNPNVSWASDNTAVATVVDGVVTTVGAGTANITVTTEDGNHTASCAVTVTATVHAGTQADPFSSEDAVLFGNTLAHNQVTTKDYYIEGDVTKKVGTFNSSYGNFTFWIDNFECYQVYKDSLDGRFTAESDIEVGDHVVVCGKITKYSTTIETKGKQAYVVSVVKPTFAVTGVTLDQETATISVGANLTLTATVAPSNATNPAITWTSSDEAVATVANGVVTGVAAGSATITVTTTDGSFTASCAVTVQAGAISVTGVTLDATETEITIDDTKTLVATVAPSTATDKTVSWSSSNEAVATVADGVVTGIAEGTATITVTTTDGSFTATCDVTVNKKTEYVYTRVTAATDVTAGGTFIIGYEATANSGTIIPMLLTNNGSYMNKGDAITMSSLSDPTAYMVTVGASSFVEGAVTLKAGTKFIGNDNSKNSAKLFDAESANTAFDVTVGTNDVVTLKIAACSSYHTLQYNTGNPRFACYGGTQKSPVMYKVTVKQ